MKIKTLSIRLDSRYHAVDLQETAEFLGKIRIQNFTTHFSEEKDPKWHILVVYHETSGEKSFPGSEAKHQDGSIENARDKLLNELRAWRKEKSQTIQVPPWIICSNESLEALADSLPKSLEALKEIKGFGKHKAEKYGNEILELIRKSFL